MKITRIISASVAVLVAASTSAFASIDTVGPIATISLTDFTVSIGRINQSSDYVDPSVVFDVSNGGSYASGFQFSYGPHNEQHSVAYSGSFLGAVSVSDLGPRAGSNVSMSGNPWLGTGNVSASAHALASVDLNAIPSQTEADLYLGDGGADVSIKRKHESVPRALQEMREGRARRPPQQSIKALSASPPLNTGVEVRAG